MDRRTFMRNVGASGAAVLSGQGAAEARQDGKLVLAMVGTHHIHAPGYADRLRKADNVTVKYVWDPDPVRAKDWAAKLGATVAKSPEEVWAQWAGVGERWAASGAVVDTGEPQRDGR